MVVCLYTLGSEWGIVISVSGWSTRDLGSCITTHSVVRVYAGILCCVYVYNKLSASCLHEAPKRYVKYVTIMCRIRRFVACFRSFSSLH